MTVVIPTIPNSPTTTPFNNLSLLSDIMKYICNKYFILILENYILS